MNTQCEHLAEPLLRTAARWPDRQALWWNGRTITYGELDASVEAIRGNLIRAGVSPGAPVGILGLKSPGLVAAIQAVLRQDAVYVPLDARLPSARIAAMVAACGIQTVVMEESGRRHESALRDAAVKSLVSTETAGVSPSRSASALNARRDDLAYVLHTSGSTGAPKGVMITHGNALAFVEWAVEHFRFERDDRLLCHAPLTFDLPVFDLYATFLLGACAVLVADTAALFPSEAVRVLRAGSATSLFMVPSAIMGMMSRGGLMSKPPGSLRRLMYSGEPFPVPRLREFLEWCRGDIHVANLYGPIETNACTYFDVKSLDSTASAVPIGYPIANTEIRLIGGETELDGEVVVAGPTVAMGYWRQPELTAERWVERDGKRWYRTGDLARRDQGGRLWYAGRRDFMVKSRGFRIELEEVEAAIGRCPGVSEAIVVALPHEELGNVLYAWVTPGAVAESDVKSALKNVLPSYMVPQRVFSRQDLPRTQSGKLDRGALMRAAGEAVLE